MATLYEYYIVGDSTQGGIAGVNWEGQTFTPSEAHTITSVKLKLFRDGLPGTITVSIRATSGGLPTGADLASGTTDGDTLTGAAEWREITLGAGTELLASTKYAIVVRALSGVPWTDYVQWRTDATGTYTGGNRINSVTSGVSWTTIAAYDYMFEEWGEPPAPEPPTVTIQPMTDILRETATGHGTITDLGNASVSQHGHCWSTSPNPTTSDDKTELGIKSETGAFTSNLTGLLPRTTYHVRAYAKNAEGTSYSSEISFQTMPTLYEYYNTGDDHTANNFGANWEGQTFTPSKTHTITSVKLKLFRVGSPGTFTVSIRATSGGLPTGGDLCSGTIDGDTLGEAAGWYKITLGAGVILEAATKYAICIRAVSGDTDNRVDIRSDNTSPTYTDGSRCSSSDSGSSWFFPVGGENSDDQMFEEWGNPTPTAGLPNPLGQLLDI